ncbi:dipeptidase [Sphingoaurantiacus capsulatus]|uniref:Dipeptidase n=1 Tax=Sphingoaurantiacus capsulatus TaxID=1771310 RepID=A0ABV7X8I1_9SPHN
MIGRRNFLMGAGALAAASSTRAFAAEPPAKAMYHRAMVIDALGGPGGYDPKQERGAPMTAKLLADARASGVTAVNITISAVGNIPTSFEDSVDQLAEMNREIDLNPGLFMAVRKGADLRAAKDSGRMGLIYGMQDSMPFGADFRDKLGVFHRLGVRIVQPTYNIRNLFGDGCLEPANGGLSRLGRELVEELNKRRILVDVSHAGSKVHEEVLALSKAPIAITHSGCRALRDHPRNTHDAVMKKLADKGGVIGMYFMPYLRPEGGQPRAQDLIAHIEHAWKVAGEDHVGLGTDGSITGTDDNPEFRKRFREMTERRVAAGYAAPGDENPTGFLFIKEYNDPRRFETLAGDLLKRGHSTGKVEKLLGANFARLFGEVWG